MKRGAEEGRRAGRTGELNFAGEDNDPTKAACSTSCATARWRPLIRCSSTAQEIQPQRLSEEVDRRDELAKLIVKSEYHAQGDRQSHVGPFPGLWFTKPVDDMGPHNPPSHPELLERLAADFASGNSARRHSYDLKDLIRWIVLSEPYSLVEPSHRPNNKKDDPSLGEKPMFSHFYLRQMRAEELYESLLDGHDADKIGGSYEEQEKTKDEWLKQFTIAFGTDDNDETTTFNGTIPQTLMMMNGDLMKKAIEHRKGSFLEHVRRELELNNAAKINYLVLAGSGPASRPAQRDRLRQSIDDARGGDAVAALQDVWWAVLNSNEFILNH